MNKEDRGAAPEPSENTIASLDNLCPPCIKLIQDLAAPLKKFISDLIEEPTEVEPMRQLLIAHHHQSLEGQRTGTRSGCGVCCLLWQGPEKSLSLRRGGLDHYLDPPTGRHVGANSELGGEMDLTSSLSVAVLACKPHDPTWAETCAELVDIRLAFEVAGSPKGGIPWLTLALCLTKSEMEIGPTAIVAEASPSPMHSIWPAANPSRAAISTRSQATIDLAATWLKCCREDHVLCGRSWTEDDGNRRLPTRLIDIGSSGSDDMRLCHTPELTTDPSQRQTTLADYRYVALSHCWGKADFVKLSLNNHAAFSEGFSIRILPQTWQDAISVSRQLGYPYIWIDAICIIQDCSRDIEAELAVMHQVYGNCDLNIAALVGDDSHRGLFTSRRPVRALDRSNPGCRNGIERLLCGSDWPDGYGLEGVALYRDNAAPDIDDRYHRAMHLQPLNSRGWVMQERALSPRTLYFGKGGIYWDCLQTESDEYSLAEGEGLSPHTPVWEVMREEGMVSLGQKMNLKKSLSEILNARPQKANVGPTSSPGNDILSTFAISWTSMMSLYCQSKLTYETDRMRAVSAIARLVGSRSGAKYLAGLWDNTLPASLAWIVLKRDDEVLSELGIGVGQMPMCPEGSFAEDCGAPTFSWASLGGRRDVRWHHLLSHDFLPKENFTLVYEAEVVSVKEPHGDPYIEAHGSSITIRCLSRIVTAESPISTSSPVPRKSNPDSGGWRRRRASEHLDPRAVGEGTTHVATLLVIASLSGQHTDLTQYCLHLHQASGTDSVEYRRVGLTMLRWRHAEFQLGGELPPFAAGMTEETLRLI